LHHAAEDLDCTQKFVWITDGAGEPVAQVAHPEEVKLAAGEAEAAEARDAAKWAIDKVDTGFVPDANK